MRRIWKLIVAVWKLLVGAMLCQFLLTAVLAVGWTYRFMQRSALRAWWKAGEGGDDFQKFLAGHESTRGHRTGPNWFLAQNPRETVRREWTARKGIRSKAKAVFSGLAGSLLHNARIGAAGILNTWVLTLLPVTLWLFGWYAGWNNSFNKGYEQYYFGMLISWIGITLFIAVMLYLPLAQARQAVTGRWQSFYEYRLIRSLIRRRPLPCLLLAACYSIASLPVAVLIAFTLFIEQINPNTREMTDLEFLNVLNTYFFWTGVVGFSAFVVLRVLATRVYAGAVVSAVRDGDLSVDKLGAIESLTLERLGLSKAEDRPQRRAVIRIARSATRPFWRTSVVTATVLVWFTFVAQIYVREFLNYHPVRGWMNQPLVQLPWFRYVPGHLKDSARNMPQR